MSNPLLETFDTPLGSIPFENIRPQHYIPAINEAIKMAKEEINELVRNEASPTFENTIVHLEESGKLVNTISSLFFNINSAETSDEIQKIAQEISPILTKYSNDIILNDKIYEKVAFVHDKKEALNLNTEESTLLEKTYKSFVRNGAKLNPEEKEKMRKLDTELSTLSLKFGENVLKENNAFELYIKREDEADLEGLPDYCIEAAREAARSRGKEDAFLITLDYPSYIPFMTYAKNRELRKKIAIASGSKAFQNNENNNEENIREIVNKRLERANLLGYKSHADFVLEERMAESVENVNSFLEDILAKAKDAGDKDVREVEKFAKELDGLDSLKAWDWAYYSEKLKQEKFEIGDHLLKPYFQLEKVLDGVFEVANRLYDLNFKVSKSISVYHQDVTAYEVEDDNGKHIAVFYADFFPRKGKRSGAWMTSYKGQYIENDIEHRPHISIVCNFTKPTSSKPSLLTFNEVTTLFHEFGHALHGILAQGRFESLSGTSVFWDFVELPSQILENWAYEKDCLNIFAKHFENETTIPQHLIEKIKDSSNFLEGYQTVRQLSLAMLDMKWHSITSRFEGDVATFEKDVMDETRLLPAVEGTLMSCAFSHIFQGGYAAGYYSYKWAEVLDADAFEYFTENGIFDKETADKFKKYVLSAGGREHPMKLYKQFRGKKPSPDALMKRAGLHK